MSELDKKAAAKADAFLKQQREREAKIQAELKKKMQDRHIQPLKHMEGGATKDVKKTGDNTQTAKLAKADGNTNTNKKEKPAPAQSKQPTADNSNTQQNKDGQAAAPKN